MVFTNFARSAVLFYLLSMMMACSILPVQKPSITYCIDPPEQNRSRFEGKGAGAGMMLAGSMGAMGVAIGVAIDEGIGKEIDTTAREAGVLFPDLLDTAMATKYQRVEQVPTGEGDCKADIAIHIQRYGFKTTRGESDPVVADVRVKVEVAGEALKWQYPKDSSEAKLSTQPLLHVKKNAQASSELWNEVVELLMLRLSEQFERDVDV